MTDPTNDPMRDRFEEELARSMSATVADVSGEGATRQSVDAAIARRRSLQRRRIGVAAAAAVLVAVGGGAAVASQADEPATVLAGDGTSVLAVPPTTELVTTSTTWCNALTPVDPATVIGSTELSEGQVGALQDAGLADGAFTDAASKGPVELTLAQLTALRDRGELLNGSQALDLVRSPVSVVLAWLESALVPATAEQAAEIEAGEGSSLTADQIAVLTDAAERRVIIGSYTSEGGPSTFYDCADDAGVNTTAPLDQTTTSIADGSADTTTSIVGAEVELPLPGESDPIGQLAIPSLGLDVTVRSGVSAAQLEVGPGHDRSSPLPGQAGNVVIAGHRTTRTQPFHDLDLLGQGDQVVVTTAQGTFTYEISWFSIVEPTDLEVLEDKGDDRITLIAPHPTYSSAQRLVVVGHLLGPPVPPLIGQEALRDQAAAERRALDQGLAEDLSE